MSHAIEKTEPEWKALLQAKGAEPHAFEVTRHAATERPFTGKYADHYKDGVYEKLPPRKRLQNQVSKYSQGWPRNFSSFRYVARGSICQLCQKLSVRSSSFRTRNIPNPALALPGETHDYRATLRPLSSQAFQTGDRSFEGERKY